ncbi:LysR substrate-binding domain-containing protein [Roseomonas sp. E05]|uniref:LysR substrate-binding domain-containing protein n=1 Tax=Roseomonas sp. E05 TaxID=3046310 RepID=UPI0024BA65ED|nr:LysR substrate-binding domain-containing protein [Roseomonas sp. E05]MDJ0390725.1 LysR substrate-binding domain-containing protein [Roseomonas sp. E05]
MAILRAVMNARDIEIFRAVMQYRTLSAAAEVLHVSQPALSKAVRHCEDRLGFRLFQRRAGRLVPTAEAQTLLPEAERLYQELQGFKGFARDLGSHRGGLLRLGTSSSLAVSLVPPAIAALRRERAAARLTVHLLPVRELGEALLARRLDVALSLTPLPLPGLESTVLGSIPCVVLLPEGHRLASEPVLRPALLAGEPEVGFAGWQDFGHSLDLAFRQEGVERALAVEVGTTVSAVAMVREGIGYAIVDGLAQRRLPPGVVARPFLPEVRRDVAMARSLALGASALLDRLGEILTALCRSPD